MDQFLYDVAAQTIFPKMARIRQKFEKSGIRDIENEVLARLNKPEIKKLLKPGSRIAITAGSRGIANIATVLKTVVDFVKVQKCHPFLFAAMGSHGGATAKGQKEILDSFGITEESMRAPVYCGTEVVECANLTTEPLSAWIGMRPPQTVSSW